MEENKDGYGDLIFLPPAFLRIVDGFCDDVNYKFLSTKEMESPLVCMSCGNRCVNSWFKVVGKHRVVVKSDNNGLSFNFDRDFINRAVKRYINSSEMYNFGDGTLISSNVDYMFLCGNCDGAIVNAKKARRYCADVGCSGCLICGELDDYESVLERCYSCFKYTQIMDEFPDGCFNRGCSGAYARNAYQITIDDITRNGG